MRDMSRHFSATYALAYKALKLRYYWESPHDELFRRHVRYFRSLNTSHAQAIWRYPNDYKHILVIRNPYDRLRSAYLDKFCGLDRDKRYVLSISRPTEYPGGLSFRSFIDKIEEAWISKRPLNGHWRPQADCLQLGSNYFHVLKLENINQNLTELLGVGIRLPEKRNQSIRTNGATPLAKQSFIGDLSASNVRKILAQGKVIKNENLYDEQILKKMTKIYKSDFISGGYDEFHLPE